MQNHMQHSLLRYIMGYVDLNETTCLSNGDLSLRSFKNFMPIPIHITKRNFLGRNIYKSTTQYINIRKPLAWRTVSKLKPI